MEKVSVQCDRWGTNQGDCFIVDGVKLLTDVGHVFAHIPDLSLVDGGKVLWCPELIQVSGDVQPGGLTGDSHYQPFVV